MEKPGADRKQGRARAILDTIASLSLIVASIVVVAYTARLWRQQEEAQAARATMTPPGQPVVPSAPQPLDGAPLLGDERAKVAVIEFSDFECPYCGKFSRDTWPRLKAEYVASGKVVAAFRHLPLKIHPFARAAAVGADCAGKQGKFWEMRERIFQSQGKLTDATLQAIATELNLDVPAFGNCRQGHDEVRISSDVEIARVLGINGTPAFLIGIVQRDRTVKVTNILSGAQPYERFKETLDKVLALQAQTQGN